MTIWMNVIYSGLSPRLENGEKLIEFSKIYPYHLVKNSFSVNQIRKIHAPN